MFYIEYKDKQSRKTYQRYFSIKPTVVNAYCPHCGNQVMEKQDFLFAEKKMLYLCLHCYSMFIETDKSFQNANEGWFDLISEVEAHEVNDEVKAHVTYITNDNLSDTVHKIQDIDNADISKAKSVTLEEAIITPKPRNVRYTPEFIEKATKAMRDTPLKRQNIHVHEDDMESTCPACGYMLYEEANMIFNYCPTCGQALNNNDFGEEEK